MRPALLCLVLTPLLCAGLLHSQTPEVQPGQDATLVAREVFQAPEFWWKRAERVQAELPWYQKLLETIFEYLIWIIRKVFEWILSLLRALGTGDWSGGTILVWAIAGLCLAWAAWKLYPLLRAWLGKPTPVLSSGQPFEFHELPETHQLFRQATEAYEQGRYAESIRLCILALIARLQSDGLLRYDPTRTNREYQADLQTRPELADLFGNVARPFERVWYGRLPATAAESRLVMDVCRTVVNAEGDPRG